MANQVFFVQHESRQPAKIETHYTGDRARTRPLVDVADAIDAVKQALAPLFSATPPDELSLYLPAGIARTTSGLPDSCFRNADESDSTLDPGCELSALLSVNLTSRRPLVIKSEHHVDTPAFNPRSLSPSDKFIADNNLNLQRTDHTVIFLRHQIELNSPYNPLYPYHASFADNCLEHRLDRRQTSYELDDVDNVKLLLLVSGAGKTRQLLELLHENFGYYLVRDVQQTDFGSGDLFSCSVYSGKAQESAGYFIKLLYFVRAFVCDYLIGLGYNQPYQLLLAQLHPVEFFGCDLFEQLFSSLAKRYPMTVGCKIENCFNFVAIDEIQRTVESEHVFQLPGSSQKRPFYSPLVYFSKNLGKFKSFIVSGTGINYQNIEELMGSSAMKDKIIMCHSTISDIQPLGKAQIAKYSRLILTDYMFEVSVIDIFVESVLSFELCHGRARFIAFIIDSFLVSKDVGSAINLFLSSLTNIEGQLFPLKFFWRDLQQQRTSFTKVVGGDTLGRLVRDGMIEYMMSGKAVLHVKGQLASDAIRYGIGFCDIEEGVICAIEIEEAAVVECLRYLVPFSDLVETMASQLLRYPKPAMVDLMLEYLVAYGLVAKLHPQFRNQIKTFVGTMSQYLKSSQAQYQVFFPDHCCGPDILFKDQNNVYIIQVKFVDRISKQEQVDACHTTDPQYFYWNRKKSSVLRGFEAHRRIILLALENVTPIRLIFLHTTTTTTAGMDQVGVINQRTDPEFFDNLSDGIWSLLNKLRDGFKK
ncbi:hypothetical protein BDR26DRAFT_918448 [Obelidium mucronatum]|nr:hypothetical protein BDR26DRAFT_918448 [Obelidium mucronatum]